MKRQVLTVVSAIVLVGFIAAGATNIRHTNEKIKLHEIELKSRETKLQELNIKYDQVLEQKTNTEAEKQEQLNKIQELENERQRLQAELQAKRDRNRLEQEKLAEASRKATATPKASAESYSGTCADWMAQAGIPQTEATTKLILKESGCNPRAVNKSSGACGIPQAYPCSKLPNGVNTDPVTQLRWMDSYVKGRYETWENALSTWYSRCGSRQGCWY